MNTGLTDLQQARQEAEKLIFKRYREMKEEKKSVACRIIATEVKEKFPLLSYWTEQNVRNVINKKHSGNQR